MTNRAERIVTIYDRTAAARCHLLRGCRPTPPLLASPRCGKGRNDLDLPPLRYGAGGWGGAKKITVSLPAQGREVGRGDTALPLFRRDDPHYAPELRMSRRIDRPVLHLGTRWVLAEEIVPFPIPRRPDGARDKTAAAVRTDVAQNTIDAGRAKRAFIRTDARFERIRWQCLVAVFASGSEFKHGRGLMVRRNAQPSGLLRGNRTIPHLPADFRLS